ncbi:MAG: ATP-grasp domain-containing protein [Bacteroidota bacterium]
MNPLLILTDYKGYFGSRYDAVPYRSGMDKTRLKNYFGELGFNVIFKPFHEVDFTGEPPAPYGLYTSQEDVGLYYKSYIEDIVLGLERQGVRMVPGFDFLRANNNKTYMEILRNRLLADIKPSPKTLFFGAFEEIEDHIGTISFPVVVKGSAGSMGKNVFLAHNKAELEEVVKRMATSSGRRERLKELARTWKHEGYRKESAYRKKFILQEFIPGLQNDWKVYVYGEKYYIFYRPVFKHRGFRASGGGYDNYFYAYQAHIPEGIFDFARNIFERLKVPNASLDVCFDGSDFQLLEFQCVYFGTAGILKKYSPSYFVYENGKWTDRPNEGDIEKVYVESIARFIRTDPA